MGDRINGTKKDEKEKLSRDDPNYFSKIRSRRKSYPSHSGQFDTASARKAGAKGGAKSKRPKARKLPR